MTVAARLAALMTRKRIMTWGFALLGVTWFIHIHTMAVPGLVDRVGRLKGSDYVQFYVMGAMVLDGRTDALYDPQAHLEEGRRRIHPELQLYATHPNYGPQIALAFAPLAPLPYLWSLRVFLALSCLCYAFSVWIVWRECEALRPHGAVIAVLAAASPLWLTVVRYGQASAFSLLIWSLAFVAFRRQRPLVAGLVIGCLAYKPQLGMVVGVVLLASRQWRVLIGAATTAIGQLGVAWLTAGAPVLRQYFVELWTLARDPRLVQIYPSEIHSLRGFFQLLIPSPSVVTVLSLVALCGALVLAIRSWRGVAPLALRWSEVALLTILASPHLIAYDLVLLTLPLLLIADWIVAQPERARRPAVTLMLPLLYFAPFSGSIVARVTGVQVSVIVMTILAWRMYEVCARNGMATGEAGPGEARSAVRAYRAMADAAISASSSASGISLRSTASKPACSGS
jgi:hypothetical protein